MNKTPNQQTTVDIQPTFPLDLDEIEVWRNALINQTPKFLVWQNLALLGTRFALLNRFSRSWSDVESDLNRAVIEHIIKQNNLAQDEIIHSLISSLQKANWDVHAARLREFLWMKQRIETALRDNKRFSPQRADIDTLVRFDSPRDLQRDASDCRFAVTIRKILAGAISQT